MLFDGDSNTLDNDSDSRTQRNLFEQTESLMIRPEPEESLMRRGSDASLRNNRQYDFANLPTGDDIYGSDPSVGPKEDVLELIVNFSKYLQRAYRMIPEIKNEFNDTFEELKKLVWAKTYLDSIGYAEDAEKQAMFNDKFVKCERQFDKFKTDNLYGTIENEIYDDDKIDDMKDNLEGLRTQIHAALDLSGELVMSILTDQMYK